jgi:hypothetical protein
VAENKNTLSITKSQIEKGKLINEVGALSPTLPSKNKSALSEIKDKKLISIL